MPEGLSSMVSGHMPQPTLKRPRGRPAIYTREERRRRARARETQRRKELVAARRELVNQVPRDFLSEWLRHREPLHPHERSTFLVGADEMTAASQLSVAAAFCKDRRDQRDWRDQCDSLVNAEDGMSQLPHHSMPPNHQQTSQRPKKTGELEGFEPLSPSSPSSSTSDDSSQEPMDISLHPDAVAMQSGIDAVLRPDHDGSAATAPPPPPPPPPSTAWSDSGRDGPARYDAEGLLAMMHPAHRNMVLLNAPVQVADSESDVRIGVATPATALQFPASCRAHNAEPCPFRPRTRL